MANHMWRLPAHGPYSMFSTTYTVGLGDLYVVHFGTFLVLHPCGLTLFGMWPAVDMGAFETIKPFKKKKVPVWAGP